ncbi:uncharacterized protein LOC135119446 [Zophobas morio]|uniref:uncharacterized protein LOC135119446 n=1 Tax=Zophobas morio TaxID=2755281 RepID=UPI003083499C
MREYEELGHMEKVPNDQLHNPNTYYIPHHSVFKGTKIRVVFDGSMKSDNGLTLNQNLLAGPVIQQDIFDITLRFRTFQYVINADIAKMYRQIYLNTPDRDYHRIFWRENREDPMQVYRLTTVTYGTTSAPFLAIRSLQQLAHENRESFPNASAKIIRDFYVGDLLSGADSLPQAMELQSQIDNILRSGGFHLTKWAFNDINLIPEVDRIFTDNFNFDKHDTNKTLVKAKLLLQQCWSANLSLDQRVAQNIHGEWLNLIHDLTHLDKIRISRKTIPPNVTNIELHGFSDTSEKAYGAAIYLRTVGIDGNVQIQLLTSKSRVAPIKRVTIPRLELMATVLLSDLTTRISQILDITISAKFFWTDSTIVLHWLSKPATHWQIFVGNRVAQIQSNCNIDQWRLVNGVDNPADIVSRGMSPEQLSKCTLRWHGPHWLTKNSNNWPDFDEARIKIVRFVQKQAFSNEFSDLKEGGEIKITLSELAEE